MRHLNRFYLVPVFLFCVWARSLHQENRKFLYVNKNCFVKILNTGILLTTNSYKNVRNFKVIEK